MPDSPEQDPRIYFAAERTLLAWIRTGVALMGFGFAISRFGFFIREMQITRGFAAGQATGASPFTGVTLMALGVLVNVVSSLEYVRTVRKLNSGTWVPGKISKTGVGLAVILACFGITITIYLLLIQ
jgi:putative membrane protein